MTESLLLTIIIVAVIAVVAIAVIAFVAKGRKPKTPYTSERDADDSPSSAAGTEPGEAPAAGQSLDGTVLTKEPPVEPAAPAAPALDVPEPVQGRLARLRARLTKSNNMFVTEYKSELEARGYTVSDKEASFGYDCGKEGLCRPDIIGRGPDGKIVLFEVKTGNANLSIRQSEIYPQIRNGEAIPRGDVADNFGLTPGLSLKEQGYPNGIPIEIIQFEGLKND